MGALNCEKCINQENRIPNELLLGVKEHKSRRVITSLENQETNSTPQKPLKNNEENNINRINNYFNEENKYKKIYLEIKNGNKDAIYDLDYNTLEIINIDSDSYQDFLDKESENYINSINEEDNLNNNEQFNEIKKILLANGNKDLNINDFINQKIKESQELKIKKEENNLINNDIIENPDNYKIIYDKNINNYKNNFSDMELSEEENLNNIIKDNDIIEEKEEFENDNEESSNDVKLKYNSANFGHKKNKSIEVNKNINSVKSDNINNKKNELDGKENVDKKSLKINNNKIFKMQGGKSVTSYEIESDNPNIENNFNGNNIYNSIENSEK